VFARAILFLDAACGFPVGFFAAFAAGFGGQFDAWSLRGSGAGDETEI
jgi:hypothetical protein